VSNVGVYLQAHYLDLKDKPFFPHFLDYMCSGPVVPMVWEGVNAVKTGRAMLGACMCNGTIRGDFKYVQ
jgi:nucleoside-diphosphate kinase